MPVWTLVAVGVVTALAVATAAALVLALLERSYARPAEEPETWKAPPFGRERRARRRHRGEEHSRLRRRRPRPTAEKQARRTVDVIRPIPLSTASRDEYIRRWRYLLSRFVEEPRATTAETHDLARKLLAERDYPVEDLDRDEVRVPEEHLAVAENYRIAHHVSSGIRGARTEELRRAMLHLRVVLEDLLADPPYDLRVRPRKPTRREREEERLREVEELKPAPDMNRYRVLVTDEGAQPPSENHMGWGGPT